MQRAGGTFQPGGPLTEMRQLFCDLETYCTEPIANGSHRYAEKAEVMLWSYAIDDEPVQVWDRTAEPEMSLDLEVALADDTVEVWFQNGGHFDFVVLEHAMPEIHIAEHRRRDTMVQALSHGLPGALDKLGAALGLADDQRKIADGKRLVRLFCQPHTEKDGSVVRYTRHTHPADWERFKEYAKQDIVTMRAAHRKMPSWNYKDKQVALWHLDCRINSRGFAVDLDLARAAVRASDAEKARLAKQVHDATDGQVGAATQRDEMLRYILEAHGVDLPDLQADTVERRIDDPDLPDAVRELLAIRLQASRNTSAKFKALLKRVSSDGRLRGTMQFRGAARTGRWAHRAFQPGNLMRPTMSPAMVEVAIEALKAEAEDLVFDDVMEAIGNTVRGAIVAAPGKKLVVADLANIEGRMAAWLAGETAKLEAFRAYDASLIVDERGRPVLSAKGERQFRLPDLYIVAYAKAFNVPIEVVPAKGGERQIGKVSELMLGFQGGVGAWITGAATYGIDLVQMTEQVYPSLPAWAVEEAEQFLDWLEETPRKAYAQAIERHADDGDALEKAHEKLEAALAKVRHGLAPKVFVACDAIKRLWRKAHPAISSYWKELEDTVRQAVAEPGATFPCRKVKIRRDGGWLRIGLPSGRALCYPSIQVDEKTGEISYVGHDTYTRKWGRTKTYGGKLFENIVQAAACDQLAECMPLAEAEGYAVVLSVHDELVTEVPDEGAYSADRLGEIMCSDLGWNAGLPLAAAGFESKRYRKE